MLVNFYFIVAFLGTRVAPLMELPRTISIFPPWIRKIVRKREIKLVITYIFRSGIVWMYFNVHKLYNVYGNYKVYVLIYPFFKIIMIWYGLTLVQMGLGIFFFFLMNAKKRWLGFFTIKFNICQLLVWYYWDWLSL